ncbi:MAG: SDR family oxidoreductase [Labilithrix sp.]|nr:SDR family oxidoreductase [Labilithrix sp.]
MTSLEGKTALVTGSSRGIGRAIAQRLARDGATVIIHYGKNREAAADALAEIESVGGHGFVVGAELSEPGAVESLFAAIDAELEQRGIDHLDVVVNNAGIGLQKDLAGTSSEEFDQVFAVNVKAPFFIAQQAATRMRAGGRIINISSMVASRAYSGGSIVYGSSKAALEYLTLGLAAALGPRDITVNTIAPGATSSDFIRGMMENEQAANSLKAQTALRAIATPEDVANVVALIASPDSRFVTGERIRAGGGTLL